MDDKYTAKTQGKYSSKRKQELNGINPQIRNKKNKYMG